MGLKKTNEANETKYAAHYVPGAVPGLCHSSNLTIGLDYIVFLRSRDNGNLVVDDSQLDGTSDNLAEVAKACGLEPRAVQGMYIPR